MDKEHSSRRRFLRAAAWGSAVASLGAANSPGFSAAVEESSNPTTDSGPIRTYREICPQHLSLVLRRSDRERERIDRSLQGQGARPVTVGVYQMANHCDGEAGKKSNLDRMLRAIRFATGQGVRILAFPEMCLPGYFTRTAGTPAEAVEVNHALSDQIGSSDHLEQLRDAARETKLVLAFGFCEKDAGSYYNSIGLIDADGTWLGSRRKNPLSPQPYDTLSFTEPDASRRSVVLQTKYATVGLSNCFDGEFPESVRRMRLEGAEILLWCNAATGNPELGSSSRINSAGSYAQANRMWVVCCNAVGGNCYGTSVIVGPSGEPLTILPTTDESLGVARINLALNADWEKWRQRLDPLWKS